MSEVIKVLHTQVHGTVLEDFIPQIIIPSAALPRGDDGSVDKFKLKSQQRTGRLSWRLSVGFGDYRAPQNPLQSKIVELFRKVLGSDESDLISVDADFFSIGGTSIKAGQLSGLLRKTFKISITGTTMFRYVDEYYLQFAVLLAQGLMVREYSWNVPSRHRTPADLATVVESNPNYDPNVLKVR